MPSYFRHAAFNILVIIKHKKMKIELSEKAKKARRNYLNEWRRKNPEKAIKHNTTFWERRAAQEQAKNDELLHKFISNECQVCGHQIEGKRQGTKFCSDACRQKHYRNR